jgi:hypothetical protein
MGEEELSSMRTEFGLKQFLKPVSDVYGCLKYGQLGKVDRLKIT